MQIDPSSQIDSFSRTVVHLTMRFHKTVLAKGTGIRSRLPFPPTETTGKFAGTFFLVTALHNLTGREPNAQTKHSQGALPNFVDVEGFYYNETVPLYSGDNDPNTDTPLFWTHAKGATVDITILPLCQYHQDAGSLHHSFLDPRENMTAMPLFVSQTCFIIGFPEGLVDRSHPNMVLPVWKTGHIASEPNLRFNNEPVILVDATTRPGMSGAPVIVRNEHPYQPTRRLVGIYTGRTSESSDIARVFTPDMIYEVFRNGPPANLPTP